MKALRNTRFIIALIFSAYMLACIWLLFFSVGSIERANYFDYRQAHLIPFKNSLRALKVIVTNNYGAEEKSGYTYYTLRNIVGNILLFIPYGVLAPVLFCRLRFWKVITASAFLISLSVELLQYILMIGVFDIDDIIYNTFGALLGFQFYNIAAIRLLKNSIYS